MKRRGIEILLVDDSLRDIELMLHVLGRQRLGKQIQVARDGEEALDFLFCRGAFRERSADEPPKLVLLDLKLPKMSGLQVLEEIKRDARTRPIPVIVLTSSNEERDLAECYKLGVNSFVQKPVDFDQFRRTVEHVGLYWLVVNQLPRSTMSA